MGVKKKMKLIVCVDDHCGMMFNHRRQSRDAKVRENMLQMTGEQKLFVSPYTAGQFTQAEQERLHCSELFLEEAGEDDYCFVEDTMHLERVTNIKEIVVYYWNRSYPADCHFTMELPEEVTECAECFAGTSHPEIWKRVYRV